MFFLVFIFGFWGIFSGCGVSHQALDESGITAENSKNMGFQLVPEYEKTTGIMVNPATLLYESMAVKNDDNRFFKELSREYQGMLKALIENLPNTKIYAFAANNLELDFTKDFGTQTSPYELMQNQWLKNEVRNPNNVVLLESSSADRWTRDYGAFSVREPQGSKSTLIEYYSSMGSSESRGLEDNQKLAQELGIDLKRIKNKPASTLKTEGVEGGGIMVDSKGRCFVSPVVPDESWGCREIVELEPLPFDGTGHVDLFAKLIDDQTVALADYGSDLLLWLENPEIIIVKKGTAGEKDRSCDRITCGGQESKNPVLNFEKDRNGKELSFTLSTIRNKKGTDAIKKWSQNSSSEVNIRFAYDRKGISSTASGLNLQDHTRKTAKIFEEKGFNVKRIKNPQPFAYLSIRRTLDEDNKLIKEDAVITIAYRSYLNSLIVNEKIFVPTFNSVSPEANADALNMYRQLGLKKVIPLPMDYHSVQSGAVHCLTHDLH